MTLYAVKRIDDAVSMTRSLLFPVDGWLWVKLAVVVALLNGGTGGGVVNFSTNLPSTASSGAQVPGFDFEFGSITLPENVLLIAAVLVGLFVIVSLLFAYLGAIMEFVFVESLREGRVRLRRGFSQYSGAGLRLFGFRVVLGLVSLLLIGGTALALFWGELSTALAGDPVSIDAASVVLRGLAVALVGLVVGVPLAFVHGLTTVFVVPIMLKESCGVLSGWRRLWPTIRGQLSQYAVYLLVAFALHLATSVATGFVLAIFAALLLIPFAAIGLALGLGALASGTVSTAMLVLLGVLAVAYFLAMLAVSGLVYVPVRAFHRYFALLFLGDTNEDFDVLGDKRPPLDDGFEPSAAE